MKKIIFILILKIFLQLPGFTQNHVVKEFVIPTKKGISIPEQSKVSKPGHTFSKKIFLTEPETTPLFSFNDQTLFTHRAAVKKQLSVHAEFSFSDVLEDTVNGIKYGLLNTYDDEIPELFRDAPSLIKIKCMIRF